MSAHEKFAYRTIEELRGKIASLGVDIQLEEDVSPLSAPVKVGPLTAANAIAVLPMEGCDSQPDGSPSALVERRYMRFASGGAGLLWWEACAVAEEGKANELQMMLTDENLASFASLLRKAKDTTANKFGKEHRSVHILQLTHSGRYSRPHGHKPAPLVPQYDPLLDGRSGVTPDTPLVSDAYLESLTERYVHSAVLAQRGGFDGVDIKCCHRYLLNELLASHTREGRYGGSFANRTRLLREIIAGIKAAVGDDFILACRFNVFDAHPYPYGFGSAREDMWQYDPAEPLALVRMLCDHGVSLLSNSAGNPYYIYPQVTRPFDLSSTGVPVPDEHPLESTARLFRFTRDMQREAGEVPVVGNGYSWLRQFAPFAGAANVRGQRCAFMGLGRSSFAYPEAPGDILSGAGMDPKKCCIACSKCTQIMRDHGKTGCVAKDAGVYAPLYKQYRTQAEQRAQ